MEGETPTFYRESTANFVSSCFSFSEAYNNSIQSKPQTRHSSFHKSRKRRKSEKRKSKFKSNSKKEESIIEPKPKYISDKIKINKYNILKIEEFFNKKKFKLSDKFDRRNAEKFLTSKNNALMKPFLDCEEKDEKRHS